ncbi:uncharacterized protein [Elaeis guineensis]|uniref:uncharacterized protein n=1 Tax=Elaeis guineensis var. tenera TaxID=51953 RepID=UPI003C6DB3F4
MKEIHKKVLTEKKENGDEQNNAAVAEGGTTNDNAVRETSKVNFLMLGLDLPSPPLFKDAMEKKIIPQGVGIEPAKSGCELLPSMLSSYIMKSVFSSYHGMPYRPMLPGMGHPVPYRSCIVKFPAKNLELKDYIPLPAPRENKKLQSKYNLIANIVHGGKPGEGSYRVFVQRKSEELLDLHVTETLPQMVALSVTYMQIYEQQGRLKDASSCFSC